MRFFGGGGIRHDRPYHPSSVRLGTVTVGYVTVDGWGVRTTYTIRSGLLAVLLPFQDVTRP